MTGSPNPWLGGDGLRGVAYDERFSALEASGASVHGEAELVTALGPASVLDVGCGTGRVAIELARRGIEVCGVDLDPAMLDAARTKAPDLRWVQADITDPAVDLEARFEVAVAAGNVMIFLTPGTESGALEFVRRHLYPGGALVAGFALRPDGLGVDTYDRMAAAASLDLEARWATWDRTPFREGGEYAVSVHRLRRDRYPDPPARPVSRGDG